MVLVHLNPEKAQSNPCSTHCSICAPRVDELNNSRRQFKACTRQRHDLPLPLQLSSAAANSAFSVRVSNGRFPFAGSACRTAATAKVTAEERRTVGASPESARVMGTANQREGRSKRLELELAEGLRRTKKGGKGATVFLTTTESNYRSHTCSDKDCKYRTELPPRSRLPRCEALHGAQLAVHCQAIAMFHDREASEMPVVPVI